MKNKSQIIIYKTEDGQTKIDVRFDGDTVWLNQDEIALLFGKGRSTIVEHISNVFKEGELVEKSVCREFRHTGTDGKNYQVRYYNLDVIISVGYRVKSHRGTQFRIWATKQLQEYIVKGFVIDDERLKNPDLPFDYFEELTRRISEIRTSEKRFYDMQATLIEKLQIFTPRVLIMIQETKKAFYFSKLYRIKFIMKLQAVPRLKS
jgi:hypothetical protein